MHRWMTREFYAVVQDLQLSDLLMDDDKFFSNWHGERVFLIYLGGIMRYQFSNTYSTKIDTSLIGEEQAHDDRMHLPKLNR